MQVSVIIPTYNPDWEVLQKVISALHKQTLPALYWECIIVDNKSDNSFSHQIMLPENFRMVTETIQGLTYARLKGISEAEGEMIVMVDDDNVLSPDYISSCVQIFSENKKLGAIGGKIIPVFATPPENYVLDFLDLLAIRNLGDLPITGGFSGTYPEFAPVGAGMAFRKSAITGYVEKIHRNDSKISDRKGNSLSSSGDNDMVMEILKSGWEVGYFPQLVVDHLIPTERMTVSYLARLNFGIQKSWVQFLRMHNLLPWALISKQSAPIRKLKAWLKILPVGNPSRYIRWKGICGRFQGLIK